jgi:hypothetical protein
MHICTHRGGGMSQGLAALGATHILLRALVDGVKSQVPANLTMSLWEWTLVSYEPPQKLMFQHLLAFSRALRNPHSQPAGLPVVMSHQEFRPVGQVNHHNGYKHIVLSMPLLPRP